MKQQCSVSCLCVRAVCRHYSLQHLLDPLTVTWERLDYRLSWHLWNVLQALHYSHLSSAHQGLLHSSYAAQLESADLWHLAIFVLLHIPDDWCVSPRVSFTVVGTVRASHLDKTCFSLSVSESAQ